MHGSQMSNDEEMVQYFDRNKLKQYMRGNPICFDINSGLCAVPLGDIAIILIPIKGSQTWQNRLVKRFHPNWL